GPKVDSAHELHREEDATGVGHDELVEAYEIAVADIRQGPKLVLESVEGVRAEIQQTLERDSLSAVVIDRFVHDTHAALADNAHDLVACRPPPGHRRRGSALSGMASTHSLVPWGEPRPQSHNVSPTFTCEGANKLSQLIHAAVGRQDAHTAPSMCSYAGAAKGRTRSASPITAFSQTALGGVGASASRPICRGASPVDDRPPRTRSEPNHRDHTVANGDSGFEHAARPVSAKLGGPQAIGSRRPAALRSALQWPQPSKLPAERQPRGIGRTARQNADRLCVEPADFGFGARPKAQGAHCDRGVARHKRRAYRSKSRASGAVGRLVLCGSSRSPEA